FDQLHGEEPLDAIREELVQSNEVRMDELAGHAKLALHLGDRLRREPPQELDRDASLALTIERRENVPHPTFAELLLQLEAADEHRAGGETSMFRRFYTALLEAGRRFREVFGSHGPHSVTR